MRLISTTRYTPLIPKRIYPKNPSIAAASSPGL